MFKDSSIPLGFDVIRTSSQLQRFHNPTQTKPCSSVNSLSRTMSALLFPICTPYVPCTAFHCCPGVSHQDTAYAATFPDPRTVLLSLFVCDVIAVVQLSLGKASYETHSVRSQFPLAIVVARQRPSTTVCAITLAGSDNSGATAAY